MQAKQIIRSFFSDPAAGVLFTGADEFNTVLAAAGQDYYTVFIDAGFLPDRAAIMEQFSVSLKFPAYFGKNWDALEDCLTDLPDWLPPGGSGYLILIPNAGALCRTEGAPPSLGAPADTYPPQALKGLSGSFETLARVLSDAAGTLQDVSGTSLKTVFIF
ncbi:MAG: barstar family protein [Elusimicrobiaceae bacterium]|nr:barstar family protein [Elusimicrobiaceae bacterium]